ncbi:MAG: efflux RND transporter periplasmic adaptor subunit [Parabacteroides sp.]|nr:efflux RND transporter periplasmic adaptor subunit [Parabacteroides sp.]
MKINLYQMCTAFVFGTGLLSSCDEAQRGTVFHSSAATPITVLQPTTIDLPQSYVADVQAIQFVEVKPKVEGYVNQILVDEGQKVSKGQPLFRLSSEEYAERVKEAQANFKQAEAGYQMAEYESLRIQRMVEKNIIAKIRLDQANTEKEVARMKVEQAKAQLQQAQTNYAYTTVSSPFDGYIDRIPYKVGSLVTPASLLTTVSDVSEIFAYYRVNESEYLKYKKAQLTGEKLPEMNNIELVLSDGTVYRHKGKLETVEGDFERGTGSIAFRVRFPNPEGLLKHGVTGKIRMQTHMDNVYLVPQKATFEIQDFTYVYVVDKNGVAKIRSFQPLERYGKFYVTQDFEPGTTIVYEGIQGIKDGSTIKADTVKFQSILMESYHTSDTTHKQ